MKKETYRKKLLDLMVPDDKSVLTEWKHSNRKKKLRAYILNNSMKER